MIIIKIIQINCVYPYGSTGRIVESIHKYCLSLEDHSYVFYGRGDRIKESNVYKFSSEFEAKIHSFCSKMTGESFSYSLLSTSSIISHIKKINPDVVHLHCINGNCVNVYKLLAYLKTNKIKTILTLHAEIMHTAGCEHALNCEKWKNECYNCNLIQGFLTKHFRDDARICYKKIKNSFSNFQNLTIVGVSDWLTSRAKESAVFTDSNCKFETILNGVNTTIFDGNKYYKQSDTRKDDKLSILYVTPNFYHPLKGGDTVIIFAKKHPEWDFIIVGLDKKKENLPNNIITIPHTNNQKDLAELYAKANLTLITSKRETFSMVCAESLCCGTPVVGFKAGGPESFCPKEFSIFVDQDDLICLERAVDNMKNKKLDRVSINNMINQFSVGKMVNSYYKLYKE